MMQGNDKRRRIVRSWPGEGTAETIRQDNYGRTYREVSEAEAQMIEQGTGGRVYFIHCDGTVT